MVSKKKKPVNRKRSKAAKKGRETRQSKKKSVNRKRSKAAKKGWETRRANASQKVTKNRLDIDASVERRLRTIQRAAEKSRRDLDKTEEKLRKAEEKIRKTLKELAIEKRKGRVILSGNAKEVIDRLPKKHQAAARQKYIQDKMDFALRVYGDVNEMALDLAEELDIDIPDVFDDWDYDPDS